MIGRLKFNITQFADEILDQLPSEVWTSSTTKFLDPAMGGGQFIKSVSSHMRKYACIDTKISQCVTGYEANRFRVNVAANNCNKIGTFITKNLLEENTMLDFKNTIVVGNPPYNDGTAGRNPIYQKFLEKLVQGDPEQVVFIIPTNWFSQDNNKLGKDVRAHLKNLGLYKIWINPVDLFENVTVGTCTVFCKKGYTGNIELHDKVINQSVVITDLSKQILQETNEDTLNLLYRLKSTTLYKTHSGKQGNTDKYRIVTSYRKERFDIEPLNELKILPPNYKNQGGYRVFEECDTEEDANLRIEELKSFWHSKIVKTIMRKTRTSTTLDNPQLRWVPVIKINKKFTDAELYEIFNCTQKEIKIIEDDNN